jgi:signal transduction histidine kinase/sensor domain CHASE-containing protein/CheY-like chemotaxis protein
MKLQLKTLIVVGVTLSILVVLLYNLAWVSMVDGALRLEQERVEKNAIQAQAALDAELATMSAVARAFASQNQIHDYLAEKNTDENLPNLDTQTMQSLHLAYLLLFDIQGGVIFDKALINGQEQKTPPLLVKQLLSRKPLLDLAGASGLLLFEGAPLLIVSRPILKSDGLGPSQGTLLMARYLDDTLLKQLSTTSRLALSTSRYDKSRLPLYLQASTGKEDEAFAVPPDDHLVPEKSFIDGYIVLHDVSGDPISFLQVRVERSYLVEQLASIRYMLGFLVVFGVIFGALILMFLRIFVLSRLSKLNQQTQQIGARGDLLLRVEAEGKDELSSLARSINEMLDALGQVELKKQEALRESEERYRQLIELSPDAVIIHTDEKIIFANTAASRLLGASTSQLLLGRELAGFISPLEVHPGSWQEGKCQRLDGRVVALEMTTVAFPSQSKPSLQLIARDVTARKQIEQQLLLADRMASVGTLAAGVAHEINNPLSCVLINFQYLAKTLSQQRHYPAEIEEMIMDGLEATGRIRAIVKDLSTFSRADEEQRGPIDLCVVIESALRLVRHELSHRARLIWSPGEATIVNGNEARLVQVFVNLLINAVQSFPERSTDQNEIGLKLYSSGAWIVAEVRDNGTGISSGAMRRIFDPFFTTKPIGAGTGLGLSICHNIIASLGGKIHVESTSGQGTCFSIFLPSTKEGPAFYAPKSALTPPISRARILVIDDDPMIGKTIERILGKEHEIFVLTNARDALANISAGADYEAILCDLMMPELGGVEFYEELEKKSPALALRVGIISGGAFTSRTQEFLIRIADRAIEKPFDPGDLRRLVRKLLG